jgi:putative endonuclease
MGESATQSVGHRGERFAESHLNASGLQTLARNFRCRQGEIDLVMLDGATLVVVEVRYRGPGSWVSAAATVDRAKQRKLTIAAEVFLAKNRGYSDSPLRFDVVALDRPNDGRFTIQWHKDAFRPRSRDA